MTVCAQESVICYNEFPWMLQTSTDYGPYLANEPSPLHTTTIVERCTEKLVDDWNKMRAYVSFSTDLWMTQTQQLPPYTLSLPFELLAQVKALPSQSSYE